MQISIEGRNTEIRQSWKNLVENKLTKLERYPNEITYARVIITHSLHHQTGDNEVRVVLSVAGRTLTVKKNGAIIPAALRSALTAASRELDSYHKSRKRFVRVTSSPKTDTIDLPTTPSVYKKTTAKKSVASRAKKAVARA
ncbi:MAG: HPF/RaiA family ribosome-associated protein [Candidatus Binatia bacterium]